MTHCQLSADAIATLARDGFVPGLSDNLPIDLEAAAAISGLPAALVIRRADLGELACREEDGEFQFRLADVLALRAQVAMLRDAAGGPANDAHHDHWHAA